MEDLVDEMPARRSRRQRDERLALEIARLQNLLLREAMTGRQHRDARQSGQPLARQAGMGDRHLGKADVALIVEHPIDHDRRDHAEEGEVEVGPFFQEMSGEPRQIAVRQRRQRGDAQRAGAAATDFLGGRRDAFEPDEGALHLGIERHRRGGRHEASAAPLEQLHFQQRLEVAQQPADRRLRHGHQRRRLSHAARQHRRAEGLHLPRIDPRHPQFHP